MTAPVLHLGTLADGVQTAQIGIKTGGSVATAVLPAITHAAWAVPVVGVAIAGVGIALSLIFGRKGPRQKEEASKIADDAEKQLQANLAGYLSGPRTKSSQAAALANFDYAWQQLTQIWSGASLGEPGQRAITDRQQGSCKWQKNGACWNWFVGYRDPIANDPDVQDDAAALATVAGNLNGGSPLLWLGLAVLTVGVML